MFVVSFYATRVNVHRVCMIQLLRLSYNEGLQSADTVGTVELCMLCTPTFASRGLCGRLCLCVCLQLSSITEKVVDGFRRIFLMQGQRVELSLGIR